MLIKDELISLDVLIKEVKKIRRIKEPINEILSKEDLESKIDVANMFSFILIGDWIIEHKYKDNKEKIKEIWEYLKGELK